MNLKIPKSLEPKDALSVLSKVEYFFRPKRFEKDFILDLSGIEKVHFLGFLILYKVLEYGFDNDRFNNPTINGGSSNYLEEEMLKYGFWDLIRKLISNSRDVEKDLKKLKIVKEDRYILAPQALLRKDDYTSKSLRQYVLPSIAEYYSNSKAVDMIFHCISEIITNFWEHATDDTSSVIVARGNRSNIEIACADTAKGIVSTLKPTLNDSLPDDKILSKAVQKGVTSKRSTDHMGHGLWFLSEITRMVGGKMHIYSEGFMLLNDFGNIRIGKCAYWKGTIIYISLPVDKPVSISDIEEYKTPDRFGSIKIAFV
jgi:hypothetical protein